MTSLFYDDKSLLAVIVEKLVKIGKEKGLPVIVATTDQSRDDGIEVIASRLGSEVFRGSENDVLDRFIKAADKFNLHKIIRVCGDNPFLLSGEIARLIDDFEACDADYLSYQVNGRPSILTHFGLWTEAVTTEALKKVSELTDDPFYHEHVTNFIYSNHEIFNIRWIVMNDDRFAKKNVRLTIDTVEDFELVSAIYSELQTEKKSIDVNTLFEHLDRHPEITEKMMENIVKNTK
jgi:spore coat polysaccharide biosynthesis protein SpsF